MSAVNDGTSIERPAEADDGLTQDERRVWNLEGFDKLPPALSVREASKVLGICKSSGYECVKDGLIPVVQFRSRIVVPRYELFRILYNFRAAPTA